MVLQPVVMMKDDGATASSHGGTAGVAAVCAVKPVMGPPRSASAALLLSGFRPLALKP